ncbi:DUF4190 domain-containing protein [Anaerosalibacter bizertensis]|uniref:DUF4190 domain-containing protein n=1 Tax=Anaerosalibacter bizertensis TaxID=932217 RepID=UPI001C0EAA6D|nr:DUF4190 domain-containing protein [Anaerosalibacter bizertensis]MBU5294462.1 DUF4190 domain-containing protein [Anaerosalibacter bizertensis]
MEDNKITNGQQKPDQTNSLAIAGLVLGLVSWFLNFFGIVGILAIVFSAIALSQIKRESSKGKGFAIVGLISGIINVIYATVVILSFI